MNAPILVIEAAAPVASLWRRHLVALAIVSAAILILFARDAADMVTIWWRSPTFNHCLLIVPIIAWLVARRREALSSIAPAGWTWGVLVAAGGAAAWLLGEAASVALLRHAGLVLMLQGAVLALLGRAAAKILAFPLLYALFLIPVGEELVPALQILTARLSAALLTLVEVPAHLEGVFITTPGGYFEVAEACSGVKFLIAMLALAVLVANLCFQSWVRRIAFIAVSIAIPIVANGVRAFATIWVAEGSSVEAATTFDHIIYGWLFFALVIALILGAGWPFFDRKPGEDIALPTEARTVGPDKLGPMSAAILAIALAAPLWAWTARGETAALPALELPRPAGWAPTAAARQLPWRPVFTGADRLLRQSYRDANGRTADLVIAVYARQSEGREIVGYGQGPVPPPWSWSSLGRPVRGGRADRIAALGTPREVISYYRVGDRLTGNPAEVKLETLKLRLLGGRQTAVAVLVSAEGSEARPIVEAFLQALSPVEVLADRAVGVR